MTRAVTEILIALDALSASEKQELLRAILDRARHVRQPEITDDELVYCAESLFLELDRGESADA